MRNNECVIKKIIYRYIVQVQSELTIARLLCVWPFNTC